jgi:cation:H+ antiporter
LIPAVLNQLHNWIGGFGGWAPWIYLMLFVDAAILLLWRQEVMTRRGVEGTVLGTLIMPYCSGLGNLLFVAVMLRQNGTGHEVMVNCLVNNATNVTLLIGLPTLLWGMALIPSEKVKKKEERGFRLNRLAVLMTLVAVFFFTGSTWALSLDGTLDRGDGMVLIGIFLFWQVLQVFEVLKQNVAEGRVPSPQIVLDLLLIVLGGVVTYFAIEGAVNWLGTQKSGFISGANLGWLSGFLMVLPNALMAIYYGWRRSPDIVYSSQMGDGHMCIPLCIGLFAVFRDMTLPALFVPALVLILVSTSVHGAFLLLLGRLPRWAGLAFVGVFGYFLYTGMLK